MRKKLWYLAALALVGGGIYAWQKYAMPEIERAMKERPQFNAKLICSDAFTKNYDYREQSVAYFDVELKEGCWGPFVRVPNNWRHWDTQPMTDTDHYWVAIWFNGQPKPYGPFTAFNRPDFDYFPRSFRLQGHGTVRYYTNVDAAPQQKKTAPSNP